MHTHSQTKPAIVEPDAFYRTTQLSRMLGLSAKSIGSAIRAGKLRSAKVGPNQLVRGQWLIDWLDAEAAAAIDAAAASNNNTAAAKDPATS